MLEKSSERMRLCPNCANEIKEDAVHCSYCNSDLSDDFTPQWLNRDEPNEARPRMARASKFSVPGKYLWPAGMVIVALVAFLAGSYMRRSQLSSESEASAKQLQAKEQIIRSQELEVAQLRQQLTDNSNQLAASKSKIDESQKELAGAQQRLAEVSRQVDRLKVTRAAPAPAPVSRAQSPAAPVSRPPDAAPATPVTAGSSRRVANASAYETIRPTAVREDPSPSSRVISEIGRGTRINVVNSAGDWLEVRSRHGNPPGYVRAEDARAVRAVN